MRPKLNWFRENSFTASRTCNVTNRRPVSPDDGQTDAF